MIQFFFLLPRALVLHSVQTQWWKCVLVLKAVSVRQGRRDLTNLINSHQRVWVTAVIVFIRPRSHHRKAVCLFSLVLPSCCTVRIFVLCFVWLFLCIEVMCENRNTGGSRQCDQLNNSDTLWPELVQHEGLLTSLWCNSSQISLPTPVFEIVSRVLIKNVICCRT